MGIFLKNLAFQIVAFIAFNLAALLFLFLFLILVGYLSDAVGAFWSIVLLIFLGPALSLVALYAAIVDGYWFSFVLIPFVATGFVWIGVTAFRWSGSGSNFDDYFLEASDKQPAPIVDNLLNLVFAVLAYLLALIFFLAFTLSAGLLLGWFSELMSYEDGRRTLSGLSFYFLFLVNSLAWFAGFLIVARLLRGQASLFFIASFVLILGDAMIDFPSQEEALSRVIATAMEVFALVIFYGIHKQSRTESHLSENM